MHAFVRLPHLEVQVCNLYGLPASVATAKGKTNSLLHFAHQCIRQTSFPAMICGDLNHHPDTLDEMRSFKSEGYCTIQELFHNIYGDELPPTFGDSTRHDVCILSPPLASLVRNIWVDQQHIVAGHNPLCFQLQMPTVELMKTNWTLPQPWIPLDPKPHLIHSHYSPMFNSAGELMLGDTHKSVHPLQSWAVKVESAVQNLNNRLAHSRGKACRGNSEVDANLEKSNRSHFPDLLEQDGKITTPQTLTSPTCNFDSILAKCDVYNP
jgi:hypothetical protein